VLASIQSDQAFSYKVAIVVYPLALLIAWAYARATEKSGNRKVVATRILEDLFPRLFIGIWIATAIAFVPWLIVGILRGRKFESSDFVWYSVICYVVVAIIVTRRVIVAERKWKDSLTRR
jgi:hypothetical protein